MTAIVDRPTAATRLEREASPQQDSQWRDALGPLWKLQFALFACLLFVAGLLLPLADPDLPIHLATGEWIAHHHAVPFVEPFAWTRAGAPFQAYSWAIETLYFVLISKFGAVGLNILQGVVYVMLAGVMVVLGRAMEWRPWPTILMVFANLIVALGASPYVRPQSVLLIIVPLIWALVYRAIATEKLAQTLAGLFVASVVLTNTHLLFPISLAPCVLLLTQPVADRRRIVLVPLAIVAGWMVSPYALHWGEVFRLNFAPNALFGPPASIAEYQPGFVMVFTAGTSSLALALVFAFLPWLVAQRLNGTARVLHGLMWLAGLLMFALAVRSIVVWWLLIIPLCALSIEPLRNPTVLVVRTAQRALVPAIFLLVALQGVEMWRDPSMKAGGLGSRFVPSTNAKSIEPIAKWLDCSTRHEVGGRLVTTFNFGGYIPWRLPFLSESVDGRVIFPDSVSRPEAILPGGTKNIPLQPWRSADLAIFPTYLPVAKVLDTATGWHRVAITVQREGPARMIGLWVSNAWWERAGKTKLSRSVQPLPQAAEPRHASCPVLIH